MKYNRYHKSQTLYEQFSKNNNQHPELPNCKTCNKKLSLIEYTLSDNCFNCERNKNKQTKV